MDLPAPTTPIVCDMTGAPDTGPERLREYQRLFSQALIGREKTATGICFRLRAQPGTEAWVRDLAAREKACCAFFTFTIRQVGDILAFFTFGAVAILTGEMTTPSELVWQCSTSSTPSPTPSPTASRALTTDSPGTACNSPPWPPALQAWHKRAAADGLRERRGHCPSQRALRRALICRRSRNGLGSHFGVAWPGDCRSILRERSAHRLIAASQMIRRSHPGSPMPRGWNNCPDNGAYAYQPVPVPRPVR